MPGHAPGLAAIRHLKRAQRLARESAQAIARAGDVDTVGHVVVKREEDLATVIDLLKLSLTEHPELDVIVVAPVRGVDNLYTPTSTAPNGAKETK
jgi:hypothetical protein